MLRKLLPERLKAYVRTELRRLMRADLAGLVRELLPYQEYFFPHRPESQCYLLPRMPEKPDFHEASALPVPPRELWGGYGDEPVVYLTSGQEDVQTLRDIVGRAGAPAESAGRILELGCAAGRMIRWFHDLADVCEIWGADISASHIYWCKQHLSPPFHFVTTTTFPHLPFEDRYFGLVYAGSVFTHIDDLADAWFLELRRVLRPGGRLYITIHDRHTVALLDGDQLGHWLSDALRSVPDYREFSRSDFGMFTIDRSVRSQVFYDADFLCRRLGPFFRTLSVTPKAYGYQTAVLLERV
jgi:SAM-dependent methyltransferase